MATLMGVVLSGGQSQRMGRDKGLIPIQDTCWAGYVAEKLKTLQLPVVVSVNTSQVEDYSKIFPAEQLIVDEVAQVEGPLQGLLSVHQQYPEHDLLLIACDMVDMGEATLAYVIAAYETGESYDYYAYKSGDYLEPFGAIYTAAGLKAIAERVEAGAADSYSLMYILKTGNTRKLPLLDSNSFRNHNSL